MRTTLLLSNYAATVFFDDIARTDDSMVSERERGWLIADNAQRLRFGVRF